MRFLDLLRMSVSSLWKRKMRTVLTVLGVIIGTASIVVMVSLGLGLNRSTMESIEENGGLTTITVTESGGGYYSSGGGMAIAYSSDDASGKDEVKRLDDELVETIRALPNVTLVSPVLSTSAIARYGIYESNLNLQGMSVDALEKMGIPVGQGTLPQEGGPLQFLYGNQVLTDFYNSKTGENDYWNTGEVPDIDLMKDPLFIIFDTEAYYQSKYNDGGDAGGSLVTAPPKKYIVEACGIVEGGTDDYNSYSWSVYCDVEALKSELKRVFKNRAIPGQPTTKSGKPFKELYYSSIYVNVDKMEHVKEAQEQIAALGYQTESNIEWMEYSKKQQANVQAALGGIGAVSLVVAAIGIANTMMMSIYERTKEIGVMKVLGCDMKNIQGMFLMEAGFIGLIGGMIGILLSFGVSALINSVIAAGDGYTSFTSYIPLWLAGASVVFAVLVGMAAGFFPSLRAMRLSPLAAIRNE